MTTEKHGIEVDLKSNVAAAMKTAAMAAKGMRAAVNTVGEASKTSFQVAGAAIVVFNQGVELAKKGLEVFRATIGASLTTSLEFRKKGDDMTRFFKDLSRESQLIAARFGDALLPVFRGFIEALEDSTGKMSDLIDANRELIATKLIEWIGGAAKMLTSVLARTIEYVGKAWYGWVAIIDIVKIAINEFFAKGYELIGGFLGKLGEIASALGATGLGSSIKQAASYVDLLGDTFKDSSKAAQKGLLETSSNITGLENTIKTVEGTVNDVINNGMVKAQKYAAEATKGTTKTIEEQTAALERQKEKLKEQSEMVDRISAKRIDAIEKEAARAEADAKSLDAKLQADEAAKGESFGAKTFGAVAGAAGAVGSVAAAAGEGGPMGALMEVISQVLANSPALARMFDVLNKTFVKALGAIEPLLQAIEPLVPLLMQLLLPIIKALSDALAMVAKVIMDIVIGLAKAWNGMVGAITAILKKLGSISIFGKKPLGFLEEWGKNLDKKAKVSTKSMEDARRQMERGYEDTAGAMQDGAKSINDSTEQMSRAMMNVPSIVKVAAYEFSAANADVSAPMSGPGNGGAGLPGVAGGSGGFLYAGTVNVTGLSDVNDFVDKVQRETERLSVEQRGAIAAAIPGSLAYI